MKQPNVELARRCMWVIIFGLFLSGVTAFPLETELAWLTRHSTGLPQAMQSWLFKIYNELKDVNARYPHLAYGTDWLAFAHCISRIICWPAARPCEEHLGDRVWNDSLCGGYPAGLYCRTGAADPFFWQLIDCSFGVFGIIPLFIAYRAVKG